MPCMDCLGIVNSWYLLKARDQNGTHNMNAGNREIGMGTQHRLPGVIQPKSVSFFCSHPWCRVDGAGRALPGFGDAPTGLAVRKAVRYRDS